MTWLKQGATLFDAVDRLRPRTVPPGYTPHTWTPGQIHKAFRISPANAQLDTHGSQGRAQFI